MNSGILRLRMIPQAIAAATVALLIGCGAAGLRTGGGPEIPDAPRNVILIVPDGCSPTIWAAVREMTVGIDSTLAVDKLPVQGRVRTHSTDNVITDSAASATAYATGSKTRNGVLSVSPDPAPGDSLGRPLPTILEQARAAGFATGLVTTAMIEHATPAAFYAHRADRGGYELIADDLAVAGVDVAMGGGREYLIPAGSTGIEKTASKRTDTRNILSELRAAGYTVVQTAAEFEAVDPSSTSRLAGIFNEGHLQYELDRPKDTAGEPSLWDMAAKALAILSRDPDGFFLMIEAGRIDHAGHAHDTARFLMDAAACDRTVAVAAAFAKEHSNTLLIVVPDHGTGGPFFTGTGKDAIAPVPGMNPVRIQWIGPTDHTGEDVALHAMGPDSEALDGLVENTEVNRVMARHLGLTEE